MAKLTKRVQETFYIPNDPDEGFVIIRHLKANEVKRINSEISVTSYETVGEGKTVAKVTVDQYQLLKAMAIAAVVGWGNIKSDMDQPLEFNQENLKLAAEIEVETEVENKPVTFDFFSWIDKCRSDLIKQVKDGKKAAKENLKP